MVNIESHNLTFMDIIHGNTNKKFPDHYFPEVRITDTDVFIKAHEKDVRPDGIDQIVYVLFDRQGQVMDDNLEWLQVLPHGFLARLSVSSRNKVAEALQLDYIIDLDNIMTEEITASVTDADGNEVPMTISQFIPIHIEAGMITRGTEKIPFDTHFAQFDLQENREYIFRYLIPKN